MVSGQNEMMFWLCYYVEFTFKMCGVLTFDFVCFRLQKLYYSHSMRFLDQLFKSKQLDPSWNEIIVPLAKRISESVVPNCEANMDVGHYVHVKKVS